MVHSGVCSKAQGEQGINLQLSQGLQSQLTFRHHCGSYLIADESRSSKEQILSPGRWGNLGAFLRNHTDYVLIQMENSELRWLGESLKLKTENESKLTLNSILG